MPLPENWDGNFWSKNTNGDLIFDLSPEEFIEICKKASEIQGDTPQFYAMGAIIDCFYNRQAEKANQLIAAANNEWEQDKRVWDRIEEIVKKVRQKDIGRTAERQAFYFITAMAFDVHSRIKK